MTAERGDVPFSAVAYRVSAWVRAGGQRRMWLLWLVLRLVAGACIWAALDGGRLGPLATDVLGDYWRAHTGIWAGHLPYIKFLYEYPPGTLPYLAVPSVGGHDPAWVIFFSLEMLALDALVLRGLARSELPHRHAAQLMWSTAAPCTLGLLYERNDLEAVAPAMLGLIALLAGRHSRSMGWLVLGVFTKVWPVLLIATAVISRPRLVRPAAIAAAIASAVFLLPIVALGGTGDLWRDLVGYHGKRDVEIEAVVAIPDLVVRTLTGRHLPFVYSYGSINIANSGALATGATVATAVGVALVVGRLAIRRRTEGTLPMTTVLQSSCLLIAVCLLTTKVLSPQYFSWLLGVSCIALAAGAITRDDAALVLVLLILSGAEYPLLFTHLGARGHSALLAEGVMVLRAWLLATLIVRWTPRVFRGPEPVGEDASAGEVCPVLAGI